MNRVLTREEIESALEAAVSQRSRVYARTEALAIRFEQDDSRAKDDTEAFQSILHALSFSRAEEYVISATDPTPGWNLGDRVEKLLRAAKNFSDDNGGGRSLILIHYAGHGSTDMDGKLISSAGDDYSRTFQFQSALLGTVLTRHSLLAPIDIPFDVVFIIDSCYSGAAIREFSHEIHGVVEILSAADENHTALGNHESNPRRQNKTFTSNLAEHIARLKGHGSTFDFAELVEIVRSHSHMILPQHFLVRGNTSVRLSFPQSPNSNMAISPVQSPLVAPSSKRYQVVFSIHISGELTNDGVKELVRWIRNLDPSLVLSVQAVYDCSSTGIILEAPYSIYSKLQGLPGVALVFEGTRGNRLRDLNESSGAPSISDN